MDIQCQLSNVSWRNCVCYRSVISIFTEKTYLIPYQFIIFFREIEILNFTEIKSILYWEILCCRRILSRAWELENGSSASNDFQRRSLPNVISKIWWRDRVSFKIHINIAISFKIYINSQTCFGNFVKVILFHCDF